MSDIDHAEKYRALGERARALGFEVILAIVPLDVQQGEYLRVKATPIDTGNDLALSLAILEGHIATAEMVA